MKKISTKQQIFLKALKEYTIKYGRSPSLRDMQELTGFNSIGSVQGYALRLSEKGLIEYIPGIARSLRFVDKKITNTVMIPEIEKFDYIINEEYKNYDNVLRYHPFSAEYLELQGFSDVSTVVIFQSALVDTTRIVSRKPKQYESYER